MASARSSASNSMRRRPPSGRAATATSTCNSRGHKGVYGMNEPRRLKKQGLYDPRFEHDACGVGFVANIKGVKSHDIVQKALQVLQNLTHRGACGCDPLTGDGAGILMQVPHEFLAQECRGLRIQLPDPGDYGGGMVF